MVSPSPEHPERLDRTAAWLAAPMAVLARPPSPEAALAARVRMVLETMPGQLPWAPDFGCDLSDIVGQPVTAERLTEVSDRIQRALRQWLPDAFVLRCDVRLLTELGTRPGEANRDVPVAESALVPFSLRASLEVEIELQTQAGPLTLQAQLTP